jgi:hypothetical protein
VGNIKTGITDAHGKHRLADYCNQLGFYPTTIPTQGSGDYSISSKLIDHKFTLFFGDSVVYFPTQIKGDSVRSSRNAFYLGNVPVSFLGEGHTVSTEILKDLQYDFLTLYREYLSRNKLMKDTQEGAEKAQSQEFLNSDAFDVISKYIWSTSEKKLNNKAEQAHISRRAELYLRIGLEDQTRSTSSFRYYLEESINLNQINLDININGLRVTIPTSKFLNVPIFGTDAFDVSYEDQHKANKNALDNRVEIFKEIINNNPELGGKARFFITLDDDVHGIQYFKISGSDTLSKYFVAYGASFPVCVDVDIHNDKGKTLEKLARLSMTYQQGPKNHRFGLIMKKLESTETDPAYFILNGDHFLAEDEIYSKEGASGGGARKYAPLGDLKFTGIVDIETFNNKIDKRYFQYNLYLKYVKNLEWFV